MTPSTTISKWD